ncbi:MAG: pilus assembly PilX N-terminal domain-containing protein [Limnochordaceae bacterium]|nr:pilus assembly PilX N-terminal domain-containing protein [Limnochordaceae bacterium]
MALILTTAVMVMASGLALVSTASLRAAQHALDRARALYAAESGMNAAIHAVETGAIGDAPWNAEVPGWYRVTVNGKDGERCPDIARTVYADGWSGSVHRRFSGRVRLITRPFPGEPNPLITGPCGADLVDPRLALKPIDELFPPDQQTSWPGRQQGNVFRSATPVTAPPGNSLVRGNLYLGPGTVVSVPPDSEVNLFITGDLLIDHDVTFDVSPRAKVNIYTYGSLYLGVNQFWALVLGSRLTVKSGEYVTFHVRDRLVTSAGSSIDVAPVEGRTGAAVFLVSDASADSIQISSSDNILAEIIDWLGLCKWIPSWCPGPSKMGVYAPTRQLTTVSVLWMDPALKGALVNTAITSKCLRTGLEWLLGPCTPGYVLEYDDALGSFPFGRLSRLVPRSWREEPVAP